MPENADTMLLPNVMDIASCNKIQHELINLLNASNQKIVLDASSVERISTSGIQLFLSALKSSGKANKSIHISNPSANVKLAFADLGLAETFKTLTEGNAP